MKNDGALSSCSNDTEEGRKVGRGSSSNPSNITRIFKIFSESQIMNGLSPPLMIGRGGFGDVYKGSLDNVEVAIKILDTDSKRGLQEFIQEMMALGQLRHENIVNMIGASYERHSLVYEYLPGGDVEGCLKNSPTVLTWQMRTRIIYQLCEVLKFLHSRKPRPFVHCDVKPSNILLDADFHAKLSNFGLCNLLTQNSNSGAILETQGIRGTVWYSDPYFARTGILTPGRDVYGFGVTILNLLTGKPAPLLVRKVEKAYRNKSLMIIVDDKAGDWPEDVVAFLAYFGLQSCKDERNSSKLMEELSTDLKEILIENDIEIERNQHEEKEEDDADANNESNIQGSSSMLNFRSFTNNDIEVATKDLNKIGGGGFGTVYKGVLDDKVVAIKKLDSKSRQGANEFLQELEILGQMKHENLVLLEGACLKPMCLVYEYLRNGSIEDCLEKSPRLLTWQKRLRIIYQTCSALMFLHSVEPRCLVHGDLKPANILLDAGFNAKLSDFGLSRLLPQGSDSKVGIHTHSVGGTFKYLDPEFLDTGNLTSGCDVYAFGITVLEILTRVKGYRAAGKVNVAKGNNSLMEVVDTTAGQWPEDVVRHLADFGLDCINPGRSNSKIMRGFSSYLKGVLEDIGA